ncbi:LPXTG-motif cell wall anchor domain-containing protein [Pilibacter termitis]|uniref:LPXTG-motif cell wall anchor domain-containing protein n=1 Tax=Pilibacter termitis TaxID=263852 RepID=A0A1T4KB71_9ENTE|nr:SpaA isopeptide-forming pilin-related protein [Pilibacter termitis]SJZ39636.1 LPXTG-motif cell wall anchor domain-containing protein [Pilibacter termitis]
MNYSKKLFFANVLMATGLVVSLFSSVAYAVDVPANARISPDAEREITLTRIEGGSGSLSTAALIDGASALSGGWSVVADDDTTYTVTKVKLNDGAETPSDNGTSDDGANYTKLTSKDYTASGGTANIPLGSGVTHRDPTEVPADWYTDNPNGTNDADDPKPTAQPDGFYLIEEKVLPGETIEHEVYRGFISVPFMAEIDDGNGNSAVQAVYDIHLFPKNVPVAGFAFHSYVNIFKPDGTATDRFQAVNNSYAHWLKDSVANNQTNVWTMTANINNAMLDKFTGTDTNSTVSVGYIPVWNDLSTLGGEATTNHTWPTTPSPAARDAQITHTTQVATSGVFPVHFIVTNNQTGEKKFIPTTYKSGSLSTNNSTQQIVSTVNGLDITFMYYNKVTASVGAGYVCQLLKGSIPNLQQALDYTNKTGTDFDGLNILDPSSNMTVEFAFSVPMTTSGQKFNQEFIGVGGVFETYPVRPMEIGIYLLEVGARAITTFGTGNAQSNGFSGDGAGRDDGVRDATTNPNGVLVDRAEIDTGSFNAIKTDGLGNPLSGAKFKLRVKDTHGIASANEGKYVSFNSSNGAVGYESDVAKGFELSSKDGVGANILGQVQQLGINPQFDYELVETTAPTGYQLLAKPMLIPAANISHEMWVTDQTNDSLVQIVNLKATVLPVTGGESLIILILIGLALTAIGYFIKKKEKELEMLG